MLQLTARLTFLRRLFPIVAVISLVLPSWSQRTARATPGGVSLVEVTSKMHLVLPPAGSPPDAEALHKPIASGEYSLDYAGNVLLPSMGGSIAVGDLDGSGYPDLYVVLPGSSNHFFRNLRNGTFAETTDKAKVPGTGSDLSAAFGDYDHSGHPSLFVAGLGGARLYHNNGDGTFTDVTDKACIRGKPGELATSVLLFDAEGNGSLDLLVTVYTDLSVPPAKSSFIFPNDFSSATSHLYHNQGDGTFREITAAAGLAENPGRTRKALAADFSHSGRLDLLLLRDNKPPVLYRNKGQGIFEDQTWETGAENWKYAYLDAQIADFDHDGKIDLALWSTIGNEVLMNEGKGKFAPEKTLPIVFGANRAFGFHGVAADLKGDEYDDLLTVDNNGDWHYIANRRGHFAEASLAVQADETKSHKGNAGRARLPPLSSLIPVRVQKGGQLALIGVQMDGRMIALEKRRKEAKLVSSSSR
jgi:FG-GAP-like repeat